MNIQAIYPKARKPCSINKADNKHPYLLKDLTIDQPNQVWATDITYNKIPKGFAYLSVLIDLHSRFIVSWNLAIGLQVEYCLKILSEALQNHDSPTILNTDQGSQYSSLEWVEYVSSRNIKVRMIGKG
jgi:putative transposase